MGANIAQVMRNMTPKSFIDILKNARNYSLSDPRHLPLMYAADSPHKHQGQQTPGLVVPSPCTTQASIQRKYRGARAGQQQHRSAACAPRINSSIVGEESVTVNNLQQP